MRGSRRRFSQLKVCRRKTTALLRASMARSSRSTADAAVKIIKATDEAVVHRGDDPNVVIVMQAARASGIHLSADRVMSYSRRSSAEAFAATARNVQEFAELGTSIRARARTRRSPAQFALGGASSGSIVLQFWITTIWVSS